MIGERDDLIDAGAGRHVRQRWASDEEHLDAERTRGGDFAIGRLPAARPKTTIVDGGRTPRSTSKARPSCQGRALLIGL